MTSLLTVYVWKREQILYTLSFLTHNKRKLHLFHYVLILLTWKLLKFQTSQLSTKPLRKVIISLNYYV